MGQTRDRLSERNWTNWYGERAKKLIRGIIFFYILDGIDKRNNNTRNNKGFNNSWETLCSGAINLFIGLNGQEGAGSAHPKLFGSGFHII